MKPRRFRTEDGHLTAEMRTAFDADGYLFLENFVAPAECDRLRARALELVEGFDPAEHRTVFSTTTRSHAAADDFEGSGDKIRFFFEERAFGARGELKQPKARSINKSGTRCKDLDPVFHRFSRAAELRRSPGMRPGAAADPIDVHLQAAVHRRRGQVARGLDVPPHSRRAGRPLVRARGRDQENGACGAVPAGIAAAEIPLRAQGRQVDGIGAGFIALAGGTAGWAGGGQGIADRPARPAAPLQWA